ncbi:MAG: ATP-binding cassette domain-containing protein, partial [Heliobacteriaceae bacterium]|nr:ATP-binding cassette domain-containing protein [Heliobacteriaceae bacterium]
MAQIDIKNLTFAYDGSYDNIFDDVSFRLDTDWRLGFVGRNGRGKTTLLNLLMGKFKYSGTISAKFDFEYFPYVIPDKTLNTIDIAESLSDDFELWRLERELSYLNLDDEILYRPFNTLSNGERTKVLLAILFL